MDKHGSMSLWSLPLDIEQQHNNSLHNSNNFMLNFPEFDNLSGIFGQISPINTPNYNEITSSLKTRSDATVTHNPQVLTDGMTTDDGMSTDHQTKKVTDLPRKRRKNHLAKMHSLSEKKRRQNIKTKMMILQQMVPNANKLDTSSMLDKVISHIKALQTQVQINQIMQGPNPFQTSFMNPLALQIAPTQIIAPNLPFTRSLVPVPVLPSNYVVPQFPTATFVGHASDSTKVIRKNQA